MEMIPPARGREYSIRSVFLMMPRAVTVITNFPSVNSRTGRIDAISSPGERDRRFTMARPFEARPASGNSWTFSQYTFPWSEKKRT